MLAGGRGKGTFSSGLQGGVKLSRKYDVTLNAQFQIHFLLSLHILEPVTIIILLYPVLMKYHPLLIK